MGYDNKTENSVRYGRSKEKRSDAKLVAMAAVINAEGFLKYSRIYQGNISNNKTLSKTISELSAHTSQTVRNPVIVMDAGIMTGDNAKMLKQQGYDYIGEGIDLCRHGKIVLVLYIF